MKKPNLFSLTLLLITSVFFWSCDGASSNSAEGQKDSTNTKADNNGYKDHEVHKNFDKSYQGKLEGHGMVHLNLRRYGNDLSGSYWTDEQRQEIYLKGDIKDDGQFSLDEFKKGTDEKTGTFVGTFSDDNLFTGEWKSIIHKGEVHKFEFKAIETIKGLNQIKLERVEWKQKSTDGTCDITVNYPELINMPVVSLQRMTNELIKDFFLTTEETSIISNCKEPYVKSIAHEVTYFWGEIISIYKKYQLDSEKDAKHSHGGSQGVTINFRRGKIYEIRDIFLPNRLDQLNEIVSKKINKACYDGLSKEMLDACKIKPQDRDNFSLNKENMTFHLTQKLPEKYRGCGYIKIEYKKLSHLFNPSGPLASLIKK